MTGWTDPDLELRLGRLAVSPREARRALQLLMTSSCDDVFADHALLAASEVVTNAVMYTADGCELSAWFSAIGPHLRVEVVDRSTVIPDLPRPPEEAQVTGRGLRVVAAVASSWGIDPLPTGKRVWFELHDGIPGSPAV